MLFTHTSSAVLLHLFCCTEESGNITSNAVQRNILDSGDQIQCRLDGKYSRNWHHAMLMWQLKCKDADESKETETSDRNQDRTTSVVFLLSVRFRSLRLAWTQMNKQLKQVWICFIKHCGNGFKTTDGTEFTNPCRHGRETLCIQHLGMETGAPLMHGGVYLA